MDRSQFNILVVDDTESHRYALERGLRAQGFGTMRGRTGSEAIELAEYASAVVLDVHLGDALDDLLWRHGPQPLH